MDRSNILTVATGDAEPASVAVVVELQSVIAQVDSFLLDWLQRLEHNIAAFDQTPGSNSSPPDQILRKRIEQFELEKSCWETERDSQEKRIEEKFEQLSAAWLRLEAERRVLLQTKESHPHLRPPTPPADAGNISCDSEKSSASQPIANYQPSPIPSLALNTHQTSDDAVKQFERMRQQIASSRLHSRQT